jgi:hypothetical protein
MNAMDIMIHIDESLDSDQKLTLEAALRDMQGVVAPPNQQAPPAGHRV